MNLPDFSNSPGAIAIDLDGTLLDSNSKLSDCNRAAVMRCLANGLPIIIATARAERSIRRLIGDELANSCSQIMLNGALAKAAPPLSGFIKETLPSSVVESIVKLILDMESEVRLVVELEGYEFGANLQLDPETLWKINSATPDMVLPLEQAIDRIPTKVAVYGLGRDLSAVVAEVSRQFGELVSVIPSNTARFFSVVNITASKSNALQCLLNSKQISMDNVVAIGDDIPDLDMLASCGIPIAMGNAVPEVKAITRYQTMTNDEDGIALVLEQMLSAIEE